MALKDNRLKEFDYARGFFILMVSWVHMAFFIGGLSLQEIFYYTPTYPEIKGLEYILWTFSEQLSPACFFILMGISLELSLRKMGAYLKNKFPYKRGLFIAGVGSVLIQPCYLIGPLEVIGDAGPTGLKTYIVVGIFVTLGATLITTTWIRGLIFNISNKKYSQISGLIGLFFLIVSGCVEAFDHAIDHYVNSSNTFFQSLIEIILVGGKTGVLKTTFSFIPWLGYSLIGIWYANHIQSSRIELRITLALLLAFFLIQAIETGSYFPWETMFFISKYPPSIPLSIVCIAYFFLIVNIFRNLKENKALILLGILGKNSLFAYFIHFPLFAIGGWLIKKATDSYIEDFMMMNLVWIFGMLFVTYLTYKFSVKKAMAPPLMCRGLQYL